jgi:hypothetical protein
MENYSTLINDGALLANNVTKYQYVRLIDIFGI